MHIYGAAVANEIPAPHTLEDEFAREHLSFVFSKEDQQFIFLRLELQRLFIQGYFATRYINDKVSKSKGFMRCR